MTNRKDQLAQATGRSGVTSPLTSAWSAGSLRAPGQVPGPRAGRPRPGTWAGARSLTSPWRTASGATPARVGRNAISRVAARVRPSAQVSGAAPRCTQRDTDRLPSGRVCTYEGAQFNRHLVRFRVLCSRAKRECSRARCALASSAHICSIFAFINFLLCFCKNSETRGMGGGFGLLNPRQIEKISCLSPVPTRFLC